MPKWIFSLLLLFSLAGYFMLGYILDRSAFYPLISVYGCLFLIYFLFLTYLRDESFTILLGAGLLFRFILIFSLPSLSDDFYRFVWDGHIQQSGINPFDFTPREYLKQYPDLFLQQIFPYLNSPDYYSVYPQVCQTIFKIASAFSRNNLMGNVIILKSIIFLAECGSILVLYKLLKLKGQNYKAVLYYALNPLVILELTGNIHFEALMIFFVLLAAWFLEKQKYISSAAAMAMAIQSKLLPLIALPLLINKLGFRKAITYGIACLMITAFLSLGLLNSGERLTHFFNSLQLYYGKFEFNGGLYLLLRSIGWRIFHYNPIMILSKIMFLLTITGILYIYLQKMEMLEGFFWLLIIYLLGSVIVHPWYLSPLIALSAFVKYRFVLIWSALIPLTYITYRSFPYSENYWLISFEYLFTFGWFLWEYRRMHEVILHKSPEAIQNN